MQISFIIEALQQKNSICEAFFELSQRDPESRFYEQIFLDRASASRTFEACSRAQALVTVERLAFYLQSLGVKVGSRVAILSSTRPEWVLSDLAILACGAVSVSVYQSLTAAEAGYILYDSQSEIVFAENQEQLYKLLSLIEAGCEIPASEERPAQRVRINLKKILCFEQFVVPNNEKLRTERPDLTISFAQALEQGSRGGVFKIPLLKRSDLASLVYTSGTTGPPKGVMQTHGNHLSNVRQVLEGELVKAGHSIMLFLPLAHSFARLMAYMGALSPCSLKFPAVADRKSSKVNTEALTADIRAAGANVVPIVPRILEKMRDGILNLAKKSGLRGALLRLTLWSAREVYLGRESSVSAPFVTRLVFSCTSFMRATIKRGLFGKDFLYSVSGGAKLNPEVCRFFDTLGIEVLEGYGLTETCVATNANRPGKKRIGTVGPVLAQDIKIKIAPDGEILFSGPNVALGYLGRESATKASWDSDGWFHTGDLGQVDAAGYLSIVGRKKEILVTSYGKNIAPEGIEQQLKASPYISQAVLVGDARAYCVALLTLELAGIKTWAKENKLEYGPELLSSAKVRDLIATEVEKVNKNLASYESVKKFFTLPEDFSIENGLLTPTLKVKRNEVQKRFATEIESLYLA